MRHLGLILTLVILAFPHPVTADREYSPHLQANVGSIATINTPLAGQAVQGSVVIRGNASMDGFRSYEIDFSYSQDLTNTWFLIQESTSPVQDGILAVWDTTTITDGDYSLRLLVTLTDGNQMEVLINGLRVRNYTPIETDIPTPIPPTIVPGIPATSSTPRIKPSQMLTPQPSTPTALPTNPAEISSSQMIFTLGKGAAYTLGIFALLGAYLGIRAMLRNRN